jgi:hypothetical protein
MSFFQQTNIAEYSYHADQILKRAFEVVRNREMLSSWDRRSLDVNRTKDLRAVNHFCRVNWGKSISRQFAKRFYRADKNIVHAPAFLVTVCSTACVTAVNEQDADVSKFKSHLRAGLRGLSYLGALEPAYFSHAALGANVFATTFISWHLHVIVWGMAYRDLKFLVADLNASRRYRPVAEGLKGVDCRLIRHGELPATVGYVFKPALRGYRLAKISGEQEGLLLARFKQRQNKLRPGEQVNLFHVMKHLSLDALAVAGGEGVAMLSAAKQAC